MLRLPDPEILGPEAGSDRVPESTAPPAAQPELSPGLVGGNVAPFVPRRPRNPLFRQMGRETEREATVEPLRPERRQRSRPADSPRAEHQRSTRGARRVGETRSRPAQADRAAHECQACPVGLAFSAVQSARPETFDHLVGATRELVAAVRSFMEGIEETLERSGSRAGSAACVEHFDVE